MTKKVTRAQRRFVEMLVAGFTGADAARAIKPQCKVPKQLAWKWRQLPQVQALYEQMTKEAEQDAGIEAHRVLREIAAIAFGDIRTLFDEHGNLKALHTLTAEQAAQIAAVETDELWFGTGEDRRQTGVVRKVKRFDKLAALEKLGKRLKLWAERHEHELGEKTLEQLVAASMQGNDDARG